MDIKQKVQSKSLLEWVFSWNQARLVIAGATLVLAQKTPILTYFSIPLITPLAGTFMTLAWLISGLAGVYLIYTWYHSGKTVFGGTNTKDMVAFWIASISGVHLGIAAIYMNIGFSLTPTNLSVPLMILTGLAYFWSAYHLHSQGGAKALFLNSKPSSETPIASVDIPTQENL